MYNFWKKAVYTWMKKKKKFMQADWNKNVKYAKQSKAEGLVFFLRGEVNL